MRIKVSNFLGAFPRVHTSKLKDTAAEKALNVDVTSGVLRPFYNLSLKQTLNAMGSEIKTIHFYKFPDKEGFFQFPDFVDIAYSPIADDQYRRVYWSGDSRVEGHLLYSYTPKLTSGTQYNPITWYKVGVPAPTQAPILQSQSTTLTEEELEELSDEARIYVYTYVSETGEESAPSPASPLIYSPHDNSTVTIGNLVTDTNASSGRLLKYKRIYRSLTDSSGNANLYFVGQIAISSSSFTDNLDSDAVNTSDPIPSITWDAPRQNMQGLNVTPKGVNYAFTDKIACFSEPYYPYAWPRDYEVTLQYEIVAMGHYEDYIICATTGTPYLISGIDPGSTSINELPLNEPCISKRSMVSMAKCVCYASPNGIVMAYGATAKLISDSFFDKDTWTALKPESIHAVEHRGKYLFFYNNGVKKGAYLFDPLQVDFGLVELDIWFKAATRQHQTEELFFLDDSRRIYKFEDTAAVKFPYTWRSKLFDVGGDGARLLACHVIADDYNNVKLNVYADGQLFYSKTVTSRRPFRLPNCSNRYDWQFEVIATSAVREISLAESMLELNK
ncbi:hypothetical protein KTJ53_15425 [Acinetobacter variabilis]|uniref:hypothetical protein n=1 Tax=Acinetobacter variabilis TaxID=70346 RepID=UPI0021D2E62F|nr:hypothetical protein [Acinetobacter variabilis]MCU4631032.1 hypothetical protein [Acinetobacter variabilis]